jgi:hypothetical protein
MTKEIFERAKVIEQEMSERKTRSQEYKQRAEHFNQYIDWMDGRHAPIKFANKVYKKVELKFNMYENPTVYHIEDAFDMIEENKKDFIAFLKKCQSNYLKLSEAEENKIVALEKEFGNLGEEAESKIA